MTLQQVKFSLNKTVSYNGNPYILTACIMRLSESTGKFFYQAELKDSNSRHSLVIAKLEDVEQSEVIKC